MKKSIFCLLLLVVFACKKNEAKLPEPFTSQTPVALGKELFEGKGNCVACHLVDQKVIGPSIQEISKTYKSEKGNIINFLINDAAPIVDPSQYEIMKTNFAITKAMSETELKAIEAYIYSY